MGIEFIFVILLVGIGFGVYTHLGEYYAVPIPVCHLHMVNIMESLMCDSIGVG
jgi:hypothetical protein